MKIKIAALLSLVLSTPLIAQATSITGYGTYSNTSTASNCSSGCSTLNGGDFQYNSAGGEYNTSASSTENSYATTRAFSELSGNTYLPTLKVQTKASAGRGGFATAFGVQAYTYTGTTSSIFDLDYNLHGSVVSNSSGSNSLRADVAVLIGSDLGWYPDWATLVYEFGAGLDTAGTDSLFINDGLNVTKTGSINFGLNPGDMFYIVAAIEANSVDGSVDAWNTFSMSFQNNTGLVAATGPAVSAVPVPAAAWLFGSAIIGFAGIARRKKASA